MIQCRVAPSLGELEGTPQEVWETTPYLSESNQTVFMGIYGLNDFNLLWRHKGKKYVFWCGSDLIHMQNGYWLDNVGNIRIDPIPYAQWINENCENWCENEVERKALEDIGIEARVGQSFMGNVDDYKIEYKHNERPQVYLSVSGDNFEMYGWNIVENIADHCDVDFHLYGNIKEWKTERTNVFVHGRISKEKMNEEIKHMQCGLRLCSFDGFSEVLAKSILWAQYPITFESYKYPHITSFRNIKNLVFELNRLKTMTEPNIIGRDYYLKNLNKFPWNLKK